MRTTERIRTSRGIEVWVTHRHAFTGHVVKELRAIEHETLFVCNGCQLTHTACVANGGLVPPCPSCQYPMTLPRFR
jgi:hypothetical protein